MAEPIRLIFVNGLLRRLSKAVCRATRLRRQFGVGVSTAIN